MKKFKKLFAIFFAVLLVLSAVTVIYAETVVLDGYNQVTSEGGSNKNAEDGVEISKTIEETNLENYFDITLTVKTQSKISEIMTDQDLAVVLVLDISNTMNKAMGNTTRMEAAKESVNSFLTKFKDNSSNTAIRKIGLVTFNRDANEVFGMSECETPEQLSALQKKVTAIKAPSDEKIKWTNMEAGLKRANSLLNDSSVKDVKNKYIIFLTDGLPTTYINHDYTGYFPVTTSGMVSSPQPGKFIDFINKGLVRYACNYSDLGARKAEELAYSYKQNGIKIYSIGVGVSSQYTLKFLIHEGSSYTVDTDNETNNWNYYSNNSPYKADGGRYFAVTPGINVKITEHADRYNGTDTYKTWLGDYIGSGKDEYYYDSDNVEALANAYDKIFAKIKSYIESSSEATWVAEDPMNVTGSVTNIEFVGMYNDDRVLVESLPESSNDYNTATFSNDKISWDLKNSNYETTTETINNEEITTYLYKITYRVRLTNENDGFVENTSINTNGETILTYVTRETGGFLSDNKELSFPIPSVIGYLSEIELTKISSYDSSTLENAEFTLTHSEDCPCLDERKHIDSAYNIKAISNKSGIIKFTNIPSGHLYKLEETKSPSNHIKDDTVYNVTVAYDNVTHNLPTGNKITNDIITKDLKLSKIVEGNVDSPGSFKFIISLKYNDELIKDGTYGRTKFTNGKAEISLKNNETITISNIPNNSTYTITEIDTDGYLVEYEINGVVAEGNTAEGIIKNSNIIKFINTGGYLLPDTGSSGSLILSIVGSLLLIVPIIYIVYVFSQERKVS